MRKAKITRFFISEVEKQIENKHAVIQKNTCKYSKDLANRGLPALTGDNIVIYANEPKSSYEELASYAIQYLQSSSHFPEVRTDALNAENEEKEIIIDINKLEEQKKMIIANLKIWTRGTTLKPFLMEYLRFL